MKKLFVLLFVLATVSGVSAQEKKAVEKTGFSFGGFPIVAYDQDKGFQLGALLKGIEHRDTYYYKRTYLGCVRAVDYLCSREDVDPTRIACYGGSQGGMLSIVTAALDKRITALFAYYPAFCDVTGYYYGRSGGWPHLFLDSSFRYFDGMSGSGWHHSTMASGEANIDT